MGVPRAGSQGSANTNRPTAHARPSAPAEPMAPADLLAPIDWLREQLRSRTRCATTFGYGPRYLSSTGQLHKGDRRVSCHQCRAGIRSAGARGIAFLRRPRAGAGKRGRRVALFTCICRARTRARCERCARRSRPESGHAEGPSAGNLARCRFTNARSRSTVCWLSVSVRLPRGWPPSPAPSQSPAAASEHRVRPRVAPHRSLTGRMAGVAGIPAAGYVPRRNGQEIAHSVAVAGGHGGCVRHRGPTRPAPGHTEGTSTDLPGFQSEIAHT